MGAREHNFDGLAGPSHNHGGISFGNLASSRHAGALSSPRRAALQGLAKMRALHDLGVPQQLLPPHARPDLSLARRMGFLGTDPELLARLAAEEPLLLVACSSASSMWTANAATTCPSSDAADGRLHLTPANLVSKIHRSIEPAMHARILKAVFPDPGRFAHHEPLPATPALGDEGAANHTRFSPGHGERGLHLFVYGEVAANPFGERPKVFPARQTLEASRSVARLHQLPEAQLVFAQQNPDAIDQGVFHNDVISVGNLELFLFHEQAFLEPDAVLDELQRKYERLHPGRALRLLRVPADRVPLGDAVSSYLFNSQLVTTPDGRTVLVAPTECAETDSVRGWLEEVTGGAGPRLIDQVLHFDLRESMHGGGGPACLRLRVVLTDEEERAVAPGVRFTPALHERLTAWVERHYRDVLMPEDLGDPAFLRECQDALDELTRLLGLGALYDFQR